MQVFTDTDLPYWLWGSTDVRPITFSLPLGIELPVEPLGQSRSTNLLVYKVHVLLNKPLSWITQDEVRESIQTKFKIDVPLDQITLGVSI